MEHKLSMMKLFLCLVINIAAVFGGNVPKKYVLEQNLNKTVVKNFVEYVKIDTSCAENLHQAVDFWSKRAKELDLKFNVYYPAGLPICVLSWLGLNPDLPSIMLNSHMDVVPVEPEDWTYPPFSAHIDENGDIFGRGTQDDKDVAILYLEAIRQMKKEGVRLNRTLHVTLMPDEETGGFAGMVKFVDTDDFKKLNIGFALDEGLTTSDDRLVASYIDKRPWQIKFTLHGKSGHGSSVTDISAMEKLTKLINAISKYRKKQRAIMRARDPLDYGAYDSVNMNVVQGGLAPNVIPGKVYLIVDMRLSTNANITQIDNMISSWIAAAGNDTEYEFIRRIEKTNATKVDASNPYWIALQDAVTEMDMEIQPVVCPAVSDMTNIRSRGIPALGFAFKPRTKGLAHGADEYLNIDTLVRGVQVYVNVLKKIGKLGNVSCKQTCFNTGG